MIHFILIFLFTKGIIMNFATSMEKNVYPNLLHNIIEEQNMKLHFITFCVLIPWNITTVIALSENVGINK